MNLLERYIDDLDTDVEWFGQTSKRVRGIQHWENLCDQFYNTKSSIIKNMDNVYCWSDTHFHHKNIIKYTNRPFANIEHMNEMLIRNHNKIVSSDDIVIWGGDVGFGSDSKTNQVLDQLNGKKILIIGNHDLEKGNQIRKLRGFDEIFVALEMVVDGVQYVVTHYPMYNLPNDVFNIHGHVHNNPYTKNLNHINISIEESYINYHPIKFADIHRIAFTRTQSGD